MHLIVAAHAASSSNIFTPLFQAIAGLLTAFYAVIPSFGGSIILLTLVVMIIVSPLTVKSTRSMVAMQAVAPEMKKLQAKYKGDRQKLNEEMMALYKEHNINPAGGCLPMLLQFPLIIILYYVIRGLTNVVTVHGHTLSQPKYISHSSLLYHNLIAEHGHMPWLGLDLSQSAVTVGGGFAHSFPYYLIIAAAVLFSYLQIRQMTHRNPQAALANPQATRIQQLTPIIFAVIYVRFPGGSTLYFAISSLFRFGQQELMFRFDPVLLNRRGATAPRPRSNVLPRPRGILSALTGAGAPADTGEKQADDEPDGQTPPKGVGKGRASSNGNGSRGSNRGSPSNGKRTNKAQGGQKPSHPRSQSKKPRKPR